MTEHWYTSDRFRASALTFLAIALVAQAFPLFQRENDYVWHTNVGGQFLIGEPYGMGGEWYPVSRMMFNAIPALFSRVVGKGLVALLALASLIYCFRAFTEMTRDQASWEPRRNFAACIFAFVAMSPFINRDLDDAGLQLLLLGLLSLAGVALWRGQAWAAGFWLGTGVAYKFTPILFLPVLLWKRQWRAAIVMVVVTVGWGLVPAVFVGWDKTVACQQLWWTRMVHCTKIEDIAENGVEPPSSSNQGLMAALARYLRTYPEGHPLHLVHPLSLSFGDFDQDTARTLAKGATLALGLAIAWGMRRSWTTRDPRLPYEWAVVCIFTALMSPMCWRQHLVLGVPAGFLLWRALLAGPTVSRARLCLALGLAAAVLFPQRELWGREFTEVFFFYKLDTLALLGYTALMFRLASAAAATAPGELTPVAAPALSGDRRAA